MDRRHNLFKYILLVCVLMQAVALMPHHHHGDSNAVCLNYIHLNADSCGDVCSDGHNHNNADLPYSTCSSYNIVVAQPESRNNEVDEVLSVDLPDCGCGLCVSVFDAERFVAKSVELPSYVKGDDIHKSYLRIYLAAARPCRAPDFIG